MPYAKPDPVLLPMAVFLIVTFAIMGAAAYWQ